MIKKANYKGSALAYALIVMAVVSMLFISILEFITAQIKYSLFSYNKEQAFQVAESGVYFYNWYLAHQTTALSPKQLDNFWQTGNPLGVNEPYEAEYKDPEGSAIGKYKIEVEIPIPGSTIASATSTGWTYKNPDVKRVIKVRFRRPSWSEYMILSEGMFRLSERTVIYGKMHANNGIHFDGVAHNTVTSEVPSYYDLDYHTTKPGVWSIWPSDYNSTLHSNVFLVGKLYPWEHKDFTAVQGSFGSILEEASGGNGVYFDNTGTGRRIILKTDGTFNVCTVNSYNGTSYSIIDYLENDGSGICTSCSGACLSNYLIPDDGVIMTEDNIWLEGKVNNKKVTVVAADLTYGTDPNVYIQYNIEYTNHDGKDIIGVMAENNIEIIRNSNDFLYIDGALLAQLGRLGRRDYGNTKNTITIYGSIASSGRINFGYTGGTGYVNRNLVYDNNLLYYPPPFFPTGTEYSIDLWEEL